MVASKSALVAPIVIATATSWIISPASCGEDMRAERPSVGRAVDDQLHDRPLAAARKRRLHRPEIGLVDVERSRGATAPRPRSCRPRRFPACRTRAGDRVVADRPRARAEQAVGEHMALADRDRRQVDVVGDVADRMKPGRRCWSSSASTMIAPRSVSSTPDAPRGRAPRCRARGRSRPGPGRPRASPSDSETLRAPSPSLSIRVGRQPKRNATPARAIASRTPSACPRRSRAARCRRASTSVTSAPSRWNSEANSTAI